MVTTEAYQRRLAKGSLAIRNVLNFPDIIGVQEIENLTVLTDLADEDQLGCDGGGTGRSGVPAVSVPCERWHGDQHRHPGEEHARERR